MVSLKKRILWNTLSTVRDVRKETTFLHLRFRLRFRVRLKVKCPCGSDLCCASRKYVAPKSAPVSGLSPNPCSQESFERLRQRPWIWQRTPGPHPSNMPRRLRLRLRGKCSGTDRSNFGSDSGLDSASLITAKILPSALIRTLISSDPRRFSR